MAKRSTVNPGRTGFLVRRPIELPPVYGDHVDLEAIECRAALNWHGCVMTRIKFLFSFITLRCGVVLQ